MPAARRLQARRRLAGSASRVNRRLIDVDYAVAPHPPPSNQVRAGTMARAGGAAAEHGARLMIRHISALDRG
jgi:hypothetical protein